MLNITAGFLRRRHCDTLAKATTSPPQRQRGRARMGSAPRRQLEAHQAAFDGAVVQRHAARGFQAQARGELCIRREQPRRPAAVVRFPVRREPRKKLIRLTFARIALTLGDQKLRRTAEDFGFNDNFLFRDLIVENSSYPTVNRTDGEIAWTGAGQSALQASAVANRGVMMEPRMLLRAASQGGSVREEFSAKVYRKPLTESQAGVLKEYMRAVVTGGTGTAAQIPGVKVCGKTGSAELDSQKDTNAWFVGFLDEEKSPYALAVVVEDAGGGGAVAAPIARQLFQWLLSNGYGG